MKYNNPSFKSFALENKNHYLDEHDPTSKSVIHSWNHEDFNQDISMYKNESSAYYIFNHKGTCFLKNKVNGEALIHTLYEGMHASISGSFEISGGCGVIIEKLEHNVPFVTGGPLEDIGRLNYIDGCTDSLLIPPVLKGDSCFNHLHFPENIDQTDHTHPSIRTGLIARGSGWCKTPWGEIPLSEGDVFLILPDIKIDGILQESTHDGITAIAGTHSFRTEDSTMDVIAFHPDSDFGPEHEVHPMINRTMIDGVSATLVPEVQSKVH